MNEKVISKSEQYNIKAIAFAIFLSVAVVFFLIGLSNSDRGEEFIMLLPAILYGGILAGIIYWWLGCYQLVVTDKRIYGKVAFGKTVDLPVDSVTSVTGGNGAISISTASGQLRFCTIKNCDEMHKAITKLLVERQSKPAATTTIRQEIPQSNADELRKYKELLDTGVITQEEFDAKKKNLLGL